LPRVLAKEYGALMSKQMEKEIFQQITNIKNIKQAYLDLAKQFDEKTKTARYTGIDGQ